MPELKIQTQDTRETKKVFRTVKQESPLIVTRAPHIRNPETVAARMWTFLFCLLPVILVSSITAGPRVLWLLANCLAASLVFEFLGEKIQKRPVRVLDGSALILGTLTALSLPVSAYTWLAWAGTFAAVFIARELPGGLGRCRFHPVVFSLAVLFFLYPVSMTHGKGPSILVILAAIPASFILLSVKKLIRWQNSFVFILTAGVLSFFRGYDPLSFILSNGLLFAAAFFVSDKLTTPLTARAGFLFSLGAGILMVLFGELAGYPEGIFFAILVMNIFTPFIDRYVRIRPV